MTSLNIGLLHFAEQDAGLATLIATAKYHLQLNQALKTIVPGGMAKHCKVIQVDKNRTLIVMADSGAVAARLRLLANGWPDKLATLGFHIQSAHISVSPLMAPLD